MDDIAEGHPVLLFDGVCNLCNSYIEWVIRRDPGGEFKFAPLQSEVAQEVVDRGDRDIDTNDLDGFVLVEPDGSTYTKSTAVLRSLARLDTPLRHLKYSLYVPRVLRDIVYAVVAKSRYRVFGKRSSCMAPTPDVEDRFLVDPGS